MQVNIIDSRIFQKTLHQVSSIKDRVLQKIAFINSEFEKKQIEVNNEVVISENFLNIAKAQEIQKQTILTEKIAQLSDALAEEAAAIASGNPIAIAAASMYVAKATEEKIIATKEYQKAKENRFNMQQRVEIIKSAKYQVDTLYEQTKMELNDLYSSGNSLIEILHSRLVKSDLLQNLYLSKNEKNALKYKNIPQTGGRWSGEPGNSKWIPNRDTIPKQPYGNEKTWGEILDEYNIDGIEFKEGEPDFTIVSKATIEIEDFTEERDSNFYQADNNLANKWSELNKDGKKDWSISDIRQYRKENKLTWHERSDMKTMDLVPQEVHNNIPHSGGISKKKRLKIKEEENV